jgi:hypothetical protein
VHCLMLRQSGMRATAARALKSGHLFATCLVAPSLLPVHDPVAVYCCTIHHSVVLCDFYEV